LKGPTFYILRHQHTYNSIETMVWSCLFTSFSGPAFFPSNNVVIRKWLLLPCGVKLSLGSK
jgi:hypothetical protein